MDAMGTSNNRSTVGFLKSLGWKGVFDASLLVLIVGTSLLFGGREEPGRFFFLIAGYALLWWACAWQAFSIRPAWFLTGAEMLIVAALALLVLQLVPLPVDCLHWLSPTVRQSLPLWYDALPASWWAPWRTVSLLPHQTCEALLVFGAYAGLFLAVCRRLEDHRDVAQVLRLVAWATLIVAAVAWAQFLTGTEQFLWWYRHPHRSAQGVMTGAFTNRNHFAHFLLLGAAPLTYWVIQATKPHRGWKTFLGWVALGGVLLALLLTLSRGAWLAGLAGSAVALGISWRQHRGNRRLWISGAITLVVLLAALAIHGAKPLLDRVNSFFAPNASATISPERWQLWQADIRGLRDFWAVGSGAGTHFVVYPRYLPEQYAARFTHAENSYLQVALETGLPGIALLLLGTMLVMGWCLRLIQTPDTHRERIVSAVLSGAVVAGAVHNLVDFPWYVPACMANYLVLLAVVCRSGQMWLWKGWCLADGLSQPVQPRFVCFVGRRFWLAATVALSAVLMAVCSIHYGPLRAWTFWQRYLLRSAAAANLLLRDSAEARHAVDELIELLERTVERDAHHETAWLRLAAMELRRFELGQLEAENVLNLAELRAALYQAGFRSSYEARQWLKRAIGPNLRHVQRATAAALNATRLCPWLGEAYVYLAEVAFWLDPNPERRNDLLDQAARLRPYNGEVLFALGLEHFESQRYREAVELWNRMFRSNDALRSKLVEQLAGKLPTQLFVEAFLPDSESVWEWFERCRQLGATEDAQNAAIHFIALENNRSPEPSLARDAQRWWQVAEAYQYLNRPAESIGALERAVERDPEKLAWRASLAHRLAELGHWEKALEHLRYCLQRRPFDENLKRSITQIEKQRRLDPFPSHDSQKAAQNDQSMMRK